MCGIVGFAGTVGGAFDEETLAASNRCQHHRGPDDAGIFVDPAANIGLAQTRLSIVDLSPLGHQPMHATAGLSDEAATGAVTLVFNGEIYNFRELRAELEARGHRFRGQSDTEVLLRLYLETGLEMLPRLNGIFALALWDPRTRTLLLARDALGVKPLYFAEVPRGVAFASELKALLPLVPEARTLDLEALHRYMTFLWCPGEGTPLREVRKLGPGEAVLVREGRVARRWTWYQLPVFRGIRPDLGPEAAISGTRTHLRQAVHRQLVADVPVGAFLSGGLDSSAVVAFAREAMPELRCFTIELAGGSEHGMPDDLPYARRVAAHLDVPLDVVRVDAGRMAEDLVGMVGQLDEPLADPAPLNVLYISRLAREAGMKVLLSGAGGDDLFTGYRRHAALAHERLWRWLPVPARRALSRATAGLDQRSPLFRRAAKVFDAAELAGDPRLVHYFVWSNLSQLRGLYTPAFRAAADAALPEAPMLDFITSLPPVVPPLDRMLALEQRFFLADHNLIYTDKMSMAASVEVRVPFLDLELVEFAARIPSSLKQRGKIGKWVLKRAMEPLLPHDVIYRPKAGFGAPLRRWMRHELRGLLDEVLAPERLQSRGLFDPVAVQRLRKANDDGKVDAAYTLFSLMAVEIWCRSFLDGPARTRERNQ